MTITTPATSSQSSPIYSLKFAVGTDVGRRREENQDSFGIIEGQDLRFFIVADGMGGAKGGATASNMAVEIVRQALSGQSRASVDEIVAAVNKANSLIFEKGSSDESLSGMGTTFVGLAFVGSEMLITNVGDSRAYRIRSGTIEQLTEDHTLVKELLRSGAISAEQADHHPVAHMLTRSLGPTPDVMVDCKVSSLVPCRGDRYLLCSDGLYNLVQDSEIADIVDNNSLDDAVEKIVNLANERGGTDNITVIIVEVGDAYPEPPVRLESTLEDVFELSDQGAESVDAASNTEVNGQANSQSVARENGPAHPSAKALRKGGEENREQRIARPEIVERAIREQEQRSSLTAWSRTAVFGVLMAVVGGLAVNFFSAAKVNTSNGNGEQVVVNPLASYLARSPVLLSSADTRPSLLLPSIEVSISRNNSDGPAHTSLNALTSDDTSYRVARNASSNTDRVIDDAMLARKRVLEAYLSEIDLKIAALAKPLSGELAERAKKAGVDVTRAESAIVDTRDELDRATRKLSVWFGRKQRLDNTDPVDMASEVSVSSEEVKEKKELFERATWAYLKEVEIWRFSPSDESLTRRVSELGRVREQRRRELASEVRQAVERAVADVEHEISELTSKRDRLQSELDALNREIKFFKLVTSGTQSAKAEKKKELEHERSTIRSELNDLDKHLSEMLSLRAGGAD